MVIQPSNHYMVIAKVERVAFYLIILAIFILLSTAYFLPMTDLPQHAGQVAILKSIITGDTASPWFNEISVNYFTSYWAAYLCTLLLAFLLPINYAINTVVGLAFVLFVVSFSCLRKRFNGSNLLDWVLLPCFFGFSYIWGFITFMMAIPIGVLLIVQNLKLLEKGNNKYFISVVLCGVLLYFSHMLVFLCFCLIASCMTLVNRGGSVKAKVKQLIPFYILALLIPLFLVNSDFFSESGLGKYISEYYPHVYYGELKVRFTNLLLYPWTVYDDPYVPIQAISLLLLGLPFFIGCKLTADFKRYVPLFVYLGIWFALPEQAAKTALLYQRFAIFLFPFYILIFEKRPLKDEWVEAKPRLVCCCIWMAISLWMLMPPVVDIFNFNRETKDFRLLLNETPEKKRILSVIYENTNDSVRDVAVYVYFPLWHQALRKGWVDFNFAWFSPQVIRYKVESIPESRLGFAWNPDFVKFKNCNRYDFLWVRVASKKQRYLHEELMKKSTCSHRLLYQSGSWLVYGL